MRQLDTENGDYDLTSQQTVLTDTPDASNICLCQGLILFGDGTKNLDGSGGNFEITVTITPNGGQEYTIEPDPQLIAFSTSGTAAVFTVAFPVPANAAVKLKALSPNAGDSDVDVTAYLYDVGPVQPTTRGQTLAASNLDTTVSSRAPSSTALSSNTWNAARAGYLDKLNVSGNLAHSDAASMYKADVSALATAAALEVVAGVVNAILADTGTDGVAVAAASKTGYKLASDGLDSVSVTAPSTVATTFPGMVVQVWRRLFKKATKTSTHIKTYADDGTTVVTTQTISDDDTTETQGAAS